MNISRLLEATQKTIQIEKNAEVSVKLNALVSALDNFVGNPSDANFQKQVVEANDSLSLAIAKARESLKPAGVRRLIELNSEDIVSADISSQIKGWIADNPGTPTVARDNLQEFVTQRNSQLQTFRELSKNLNAVGVQIVELEEGEAEIGFRLPRDLFANNLDGLIDELRVLKRVIRAFAEAADGSIEEIEIRQISTTDPTFFFGLNPVTIGLIGGAITWALNTWKQVEEVREVRARTAQIEALKDSQIEKTFENAIEKVVSESIEKKVTELLANATDEYRAKEQKTDLKWALKSIIARVERGMTVEVRLLPPPVETMENEAGEEIEGQPDPVFENISTIASQLDFPELEGTPILPLPDMQPDKRDEASATTKTRKK